MKDAIATLKQLPPEQWTARYYRLDGLTIPPLVTAPFDLPTRPDNNPLNDPRGLITPCAVVCYCATGWLLEQSGEIPEWCDLISSRMYINDILQRTYGLTREQVAALEGVNDGYGLAAAILWLERHYIPPEDAA